MNQANITKIVEAEYIYKVLVLFVEEKKQNM